MSARKALVGAALGVGVAVVAAAVSYPRLFRERCLTWGARPEEVERPLPGDELLPRPDFLATRAVTIDAPPGAIWPWLVQMGQARGGAYTYDWIENLLGLHMHSVDEILPQFQDTKVGDEIGPKMRVRILDPERVLTVAADDGNWVWIFALFPEDGATRLVSRNRITLPSAAMPAPRTSRLSKLAYMLIAEPGSLVMERKMLLGIKERAERLARDPGFATSGPRPSS